MRSDPNSPLSYIEIDAARLRSNVRSVRSCLRDNVELAVVVKANAYGHGLEQVVSAVESEVDYFQIDDAEELIALRRLTKKRALALGYIKSTEIAMLSELNAEMAIFNIEHLREIDKQSQHHSIKTQVHIAVDAFLGREGILSSQAQDLVDEIKTLKAVDIVGAYAHFANIEDTSDFSHAKKQITAFESFIASIRNAQTGELKTHIAATSGILAYEQTAQRNSIVRLGIGTYGLWPSKDLRVRHAKDLQLLPVARWITHVAQVKRLPANYPIGYGLTFITSKPTTIAVIPQGYSDGYDRGLSNVGEVLIDGKRRRVLGRVAMNMFVIGLGDAADVKTGDEVILLGKQGNDEISAEELADKSQTINYEIMARLSSLLPRVGR